MNANDVRIADITENDWAQLRSICLDAAAGVTEARSRRRSDALALGEEGWRDIARQYERPREFGIAAVAPDGSWAAACGGYLDEDRGERVVMGAFLHVLPERCPGDAQVVADVLLERVAAWAVAEHASQIFFAVRSDRPRLLRLLQERGFAPTGAERPVPGTTDAVEIELSAPVVAGGLAGLRYAFATQRTGGVHWRLSGHRAHA